MLEYIQSIRDELMTDEVLTKTANVTQVLFANGFNYPHLGNNKADLVQMDAIAGDNFQEFRLEAKRFTRLLKKRVKTTKPLMDNFAIHRTFKVVAKNEKVLYLPISLEFEDGQVLTALVRQYGDDAGNYFNRKSFMKITKWFLNEKDITKEVYLTKRDVIDENRLAKNMGAIIDTVHTKFVKKNPDARKVVESEESLSREIAELEAKKDSLLQQLQDNDTITDNHLKTLSALAREKGLTLKTNSDNSVSINASSGGRMSTAKELFRTASFKGGKSFLEGYQKPTARKIIPHYLGNVKDGKRADELLAQFDWNLFAIDDGETYRKVEEKNNNILKELGELGAIAIVGDNGSGGEVVYDTLTPTQEEEIDLYSSENIDKEFTADLQQYHKEFTVYKLADNHYEIIEEDKDKLVASGTKEDIEDFITEAEYRAYKPSKKAEDFISKYFKLDKSATARLVKFLDTDLEFPEIEVPTVYFQGLRDNGFMGDNDTYMKAFDNLKKAYLSPKADEKDYSKEIEKLLNEKDVDSLEEKLDALADELEEKGLLDKHEEELKKVTAYITKLYEEQQ